jgi:uncharacterized membrane protein
MNQRRLEGVLGGLLRAGVLLSASVVVAGGAWWLAMCSGCRAAYRPFRGEPRALTSASEIVAGLGHPRPETVIQFGLLLLIATPVARVVFSAAAFALEKDWTYVAITAVVLAVLVYSLAFAHTAG